MSFRRSADGIRRALALWLYPVDPLELVRHSLALAPRNPQHLEDLPEESQKEMLANAHLVAVNPAFPFVMRYLMDDQRDETVTRAPGMDAIWFGRGSMNGQAVAMEEFERLSSLHKERVLAAKVADYDRFSVV